MTRSRKCKSNIPYAVSALILACGLLVVSLFSSVSASAIVYDDQSDFKLVTAFVGADETEMNFNWHAKKGATDDTQYVYVIEQPDPERDEIFGDDIAVAFEAVGADAYAVSSQVRYRYYRATAKGLKPNTRYVYRVGDGLRLSDPKAFVTDDGDDRMNFTVFGDAQLGTNGRLHEEDEALWQGVVAEATQRFDPSFILHMGDEVESWGSTVVEIPNSEEQYEVFYSPSAFGTVPYASVIGNHEVNKDNWSQHHNVPNLSRYGKVGTEGDQGNDYWFAAGNALVLVINGNEKDSSKHDEFFTEAIAAANAKYGERLQWKIVAMHHSLFGASDISNEETQTGGHNSTRREVLGKIIGKHGIDAVFAAHEHVYCRSYMMDGSASPITYVLPEEGKENYYVSEAEGKKTLYVTFGSSTGNKVFPADNENGDYVAKSNDKVGVGQYGNITLRKGRLTISVYERGEEQPFDEFTLYKSEPDSAAPAITVDGDEVSVKKGSGYDPMTGVSAYDSVDGDMTADIKVTGNFDPDKTGTYTLTYTVTNFGGKTATATRTVKVTGKKGCGSSAAGACAALGVFAVASAAAILAARRRRA